MLNKLDTNSTFDYISRLYVSISAGSRMVRVVWLQAAATAVLGIVVYAGLGFQAAISLVFGGLSYLVPTAVSVLVLRFSRRYPAMLGIGFAAAEGLKIILALLLMTASFALYREIRFIPYFFGLLCASHLIPLFFLRVHRYGK